MTWDPKLDMAARIRTLPVITLNCNSAGTEQSWTGLPAKYRIVSLYPYDASGTPVLATVGMFTGAGGTGTTLVTAATMTGLTSAAKTIAMTLAAIAGTDYQTSSTLYLRNVVAQGSALTVKFALTIQELE